MSSWPSRIKGVALGLAAILAVTACSEGKAPVARLSAITADSGLVPDADGFAFANFGAGASKEWFDEKDLVTMFGESACVDGKTEPCVPTAQAAQWAQMVNEARASGHCEGLAVQSANRFVSKASPATVELKNEGEVTHAIIRAFATQFFPEVQEATGQWAKKSINDILNEISRALKAKDVAYTLGVYTPTGGHAVLPYALDFPEPNLAVIKVYDSNWPGMERYVVVDVEKQTWYFSFSAEDPKSDNCAWYGGAGDIDITPMSARTDAQCPFCGDGSKVTKNVLLIRSASLDWKITTPTGTYTPANTTRVDDVQARAIRTATCEQQVRIPEFILSTPSTEFELELPDTASAYVTNQQSVVRVVTDGKKQRQPVRFKDNTVEIKDKGTTLTVAADNAIAQINVTSGAVSVADNQVSVSVGGTEVVADTKRPQIVVTESPAGVPTVKESKDLVTVVPEVPKELVPEPIKPGLSSRDERDLTNESYQETVQQVNSAAAVVPPVVTTTTTAVSTTTSTSTTVAPTTTEALPAGAPTSPPAESTVDSLKTGSLTTASSMPTGGTVTVSVGGFEPREWVQLIVASKPQVLDAERADANGRVTLRGVIPSLTSGTHTLAAYAPASRRGFRQSLSVSVPTTTQAITTNNQTVTATTERATTTTVRTATTVASGGGTTQTTSSPTTIEQIATTTSPPSPTTAYVHPYLRNYGCPYVYVGPSYDGSTGQSGVNTEATGRCNSGWLAVQGTVTYEGTTRSINYSYQFRTCAEVTYSLRVRYDNGTLSQLFTGSYTPPQDNC